MAPRPPRHLFFCLLGPIARRPFFFFWEKNGRRRAARRYQKNRSRDRNLFAADFPCLCIIGRRFRPNDTRPIGLGASRQKRLENTERVRKIAVLKKNLPSRETLFAVCHHSRSFSHRDRRGDRALPKSRSIIWSPCSHRQACIWQTGSRATAHARPG